jgi:hypothetical protein
MTICTGSCCGIIKASFRACPAYLPHVLPWRLFIYTPQPSGFWPLQKQIPTLHPTRPSAPLPNLVMTDLESYWGPSAFYCRAEDLGEVPAEDVFSMGVDRVMFEYFSRPEGNINRMSFAAIYCLNPPGDDDCPIGLCPNPDIAGPLVRIARTLRLVFFSEPSSNPRLSTRLRYRALFE